MGEINQWHGDVGTEGLYRRMVLLGSESLKAVGGEDRDGRVGVPKGRGYRLQPPCAKDGDNGLRRSSEAVQPSESRILL